VGGASHQFLSANGHVLTSLAPNDAIGDYRVLECWLITFMPGCLAK
jgi:hypothetical protein